MKKKTQISNQELILNPCNGKIKLITHLCCSFRTNYRSSHHRAYEKRCSQKFHKIHRKTLVPEPLFNKIADLSPATLLKKKLWHRCFPVNFAKFPRTPFLQNTLWTTASITTWIFTDICMVIVNTKFAAQRLIQKHAKHL